MKVTLEHVAAGCNRHSQCLAWGPDGLVAYASHQAVLVWDSRAGQTRTTLLGQNSVVTCLRWLPGGTGSKSASYALASGSADGVVCVWELEGGCESENAPVSEADAPVLSPCPARLLSWSLAARLAIPARENGNTSVSSVACLCQPSSGATLLAAVSASGVAVWAREVGSADWAFAETILALSTDQRLNPVPVSAAFAEWRTSGAAGESQRVLAALGDVAGQVVVYASGCGVEALAREAALRRVDEAGDANLRSSSNSDAAPTLLFRRQVVLQGHQDWVRDLAWSHASFGASQGGHLRLASASQDRRCRVWRLEVSSCASLSSGSRSSLDQTPVPADPALWLTRFAPKPRLRLGGEDLTLELEAVLSGHEDWVTSLAWEPVFCGTGAELRSEPMLLTASMDRTMLLWAREEVSGLWMTRAALGNAGSNHLGYYTACWSPCGTLVATHGFAGSLHVWRRRDRANGAPGRALEALDFESVCGPTGHTGPVVGLAWASEFGAAATVSEDRTTRLWTRSGVATGGVEEGEQPRAAVSSRRQWCEVARPQIHGHALSGVAVLRDCLATGRLTLASCSEEKVVRVFDAPRACLDTLLALSVELRGRGLESIGWARGPSSKPGLACAALALGASLPALGLSNRAIFADQASAARETDASHDALVGADAYNQGPDDAPDPAAPAALAEPPLEEHLAQHALWPESHKLYGHGNEVHCVAGRLRRREEDGEREERSSTLFASSSRALAPSAAHVWLWDADRACAAGKAAAHALTPTCLAFSPDGRWLASGGRDRAVCLFEVCEGAEGSDALRLVCKMERAHARVLWDAAWSPPVRLAGNGGTAFILATASRDGAVKLWTVRASSSQDESSPSSPALEPLASHAHACSVNALAFLPRPPEFSEMPGTASLCLALGCEDGQVVLLAVCFASGACERLGEGARHAAPVRRVAWRKRRTQGWDLASAGDDHAVRFSCVRDA